MSKEMGELFYDWCNAYVVTNFANREYARVSSFSSILEQFCLSDCSLSKLSNSEYYYNLWLEGVNSGKYYPVVFLTRDSSAAPHLFFILYGNPNFDWHFLEFHDNKLAYCSDYLEGNYSWKYGYDFYAYEFQILPDNSFRMWASIRKFQGGAVGYAGTYGITQKWIIGLNSDSISLTDCISVALAYEIGRAHV